MIPTKIQQFLFLAKALSAYFEYICNWFLDGIKMFFGFFLRMHEARRKRTTWRDEGCGSSTGKNLTLL